MLEERSCGYAVMNKELDAYSIEDRSLETCKKYCRGDDVIVERIPSWNGIEFTLWIAQPWRLITRRNIFWIYFSFRKRYSHKCGKIVFRARG